MSVETTQPATRLADAGAAELSTLFRTRDASPVEAAREVLDRIAALNPKLNAFCHLDEERSLADARASEARWRRGEPLDALDGVPVSIKDLILTRGWPTLPGSHTVDAAQAWEVDAPVTARLREAGAVLLGKTTTPEFGIKTVTDSHRHGITRNPWDTRMTPGGSSGGAAAAVAAGMGPLAIGSDGAGSVRIPSAFCGVPGMKASFGRVPHLPQSVFGSIAHVGPHARSIDDLALLMTVITREDLRDWSALPCDGCDYSAGLDDGVKGLRIAYSPDLGYVRNVDPEIAASVRQAAETFAALGAQVEEVAPGFDNPQELIAMQWYVGSLTLFNALTPEQAERTDPMFRWQAEQGRRVTLMDFQQLQLRRGALGVQMRQFHRRFDLLLTPAVSITAFEATATGAGMGDLDSFLGWTPFSYPFNLTQQPAVVVPCGLSRAGLPMALQLVGPMHRDALVLRAAKAYEATRAWRLPAMEQR